VYSLKIRASDKNLPVTLMIKHFDQNTGQNTAADFAYILFLVFSIFFLGEASAIECK
jgi:hypothetical protein